MVWDRNQSSLRVTGLLGCISSLALLLTPTGCATAPPAPQPTRHDLAAIQAKQAALTPSEVLTSLKQGNERFVSGKPKLRDILHEQEVTAAGQFPRAIILSCIDSRAPAEFIFDAGIGDFFNGRVAGNVANLDLVASMEFACKVAGARLIVVMGHTACGAVKSACDHVQLGNITQLLAQIQPAVQSVQNVPGARNSQNFPFVEAVTEANVRLAMDNIRSTSPILKGMESEGGVKIVGCVYDLGTGRVRFLD